MSPYKVDIPQQCNEIETIITTTTAIEYNKFGNKHGSQMIYWNFIIKNSFKSTKVASKSRFK